MLILYLLKKMSFSITEKEAVIQAACPMKRQEAETYIEEPNQNMHCNSSLLVIFFLESIQWNLPKISKSELNKCNFLE